MSQKECRSCASRYLSLPLRLRGLRTGPQREPRQQTSGLHSGELRHTDLLVDIWHLKAHRKQGGTAVSPCCKCHQCVRYGYQPNVKSNLH